MLTDCSLCLAAVVADVDDDGRPVERCTGCGQTQRAITPRINRRDLREQIRTVREARPQLCDPCLAKRCTGCETADCDCPRPRHPRRPVGDVTAEGLALLAAEPAGHLDPLEV